MVGSALAQVLVKILIFVHTPIPGEYLGHFGIDGQRLIVVRVGPLQGVILSI